MPDKQILHHTRFLNLCEIDTWFFAERPHGGLVVGVVAVTDQRELVLVEQYRVPVQRQVIELPAGLVGDDVAGEGAAQAAARELEEETGWRATSLHHLATGPSSAGLTSEMVSLYRATGLRRIGEGGGVDDEHIRVHMVPLTGIHRWLREREAQGCLIDHKIYTALHFIEHPPES